MRKDHSGGITSAGGAARRGWSLFLRLRLPFMGRWVPNQVGCITDLLREVLCQRLRSISFHELPRCTVSHVWIFSPGQTEVQTAEKGFPTKELLKQWKSLTSRDVTSVDGFGASI